MTTPVILPLTTWGSATAPLRALLVHGLGSNGALMWRTGTMLSELGWRADAVSQGTQRAGPVFGGRSCRAGRPGPAAAAAVRAGCVR